MQTVVVFSGSSRGRDPEYVRAARDLGRLLASQGRTVVYGGGRIGLMGELADAALAEGGRVIGVIPSFLAQEEIAHGELTELRVVQSMHQRKAQMAELADGFIALPGGYGTLEELFEIITWVQLGLVTQPIGLLDVSGYYGGLVSFIERAVEQGFIRPEQERLAVVSPDAETLVEQLDERARRAAATRTVDVERT